MSMRALEAQLTTLPHGELHDQIRTLSKMTRHVARVLAAAHRARKRQNRGGARVIASPHPLVVGIDRVFATSLGRPCVPERNVKETGRGSSCGPFDAGNRTRESRVVSEVSGY